MGRSLDHIYNVDSARFATEYVIEAESLDTLCVAKYWFDAVGRIIKIDNVRGGILWIFDFSEEHEQFCKISRRQYNPVNIEGSCLNYGVEQLSVTYLDFDRILEKKWNSIAIDGCKILEEYKYDNKGNCIRVKLFSQYSNSSIREIIVDYEL